MYTMDPFEAAKKRASSDIRIIEKAEHTEGYLANRYLATLRQRNKETGSKYFLRGREIYNCYLEQIALLKKQSNVKARSLTPIPTWD